MPAAQRRCLSEESGGKHDHFDQLRHSATVLRGIHGFCGTATNLAGGGAGYVPYQSASGTTLFVSAGTPGQVLTSNGTSAPT
jgi:hypothetical protein